jgi:hypothetical protein
MKEATSGELLAVKKIRMEKEKDGLPITALRGALSARISDFDAFG